MQRLILGPVVLLILAIGGFAAYTYYLAKLPPTPQNVLSTMTATKEKVESSSPKIQTNTTDAGSQLQTLSQRAGEVGQHAQKVLGDSIQVNEEEKKPLHESAIDYGRYIYCQQVIKEYEAEKQDQSQQQSSD